MNEGQATEYRLILKNLNNTAWSTGFLLAILAIVILLTRYYSPDGNILNLFTALLVLIWIVISAVRRRRKKNSIFYPVFMLTAFDLLLFPPFHFIGLFYLILPLIEQIAKRPVTVLFSDKGISLKNGLYAKNYSWADFNNIVLKDGLLTMDFTNNRLLQKETTGSNEIPEEEFNRYCLRKLIK